MRRKPNEGFKAKVAVEAIKGDKTLNEVASLHPVQVATWKKTMLEGLPSLFADKRKGKKHQDPTTDELYRQIGQLQVENEWLKKKSNLLR